MVCRMLARRGSSKSKAAEARKRDRSSNETLDFQEVFDHGMPLALRRKDQLDRFADCGMAARLARAVVNVLPHKLTAVLHAHGQSHSLEDRQINDIVAHIANFFVLPSRSVDYLLVRL